MSWNSNLKLMAKNWLTIQEAAQVINETFHTSITESTIYRCALYGQINLSIYFQSPVTLRKITKNGGKVKISTLDKSELKRLCFLDKHCFINNRNLIISTEGDYFSSRRNILDTNLFGFEYIIIQRYLADSLSMPLPIDNPDTINFGITVTSGNELFLLFNKISWKEQIQSKIKYLPDETTSIIKDFCLRNENLGYADPYYFPMHDLPQDACFVIKCVEIERVIEKLTSDKNPTLSPTRISTPLSRLFWLACHHNDDIRPLVKQPYKLLSIFEEWAISDGITDHLSGDTLKTALERGSPLSFKTTVK
ncbi:hypothetical protein ACMYSK_02690 [Klebsiella sp. I138]|uniref:hypothetical protein n=1 Tax=Klebsiella sp. I138 TaxID=2755385 RepID=UPI003DAA2160